MKEYGYDSKDKDITKDFELGQEYKDIQKLKNTNPEKYKESYNNFVDKVQKEKGLSGIVYSAFGDNSISEKQITKFSISK
ncbi:hypothetical protein LXN10_12370 [Arcobacter sp. KX21116]|uniref:hypothetical protein n=1 Tax=Arcobacter iocasae TaxID=2906515 RepID=UPI0035D4DB84